ncbi:hypothetical protein P3T35_006310 [Kitasatospora sp. GP30]|uniref:hypothetical protein n=1 Tax=Kitasatospora sp. GP30 TaxID=3035084 RepID=UPI000C714B0D|nr:hypothetical protein [Kitasatospora sp. GP30]MDH6144271.1 hypothetical protein [Kitasatospora sp. GP30]
MARRLSTAFLAAAVCAAVLTGCSSSGTRHPDTAQGQGEPIVSATPVPTSAADIQALPLRVFAPTDQEAQTISRATVLLEADCMHRLGFADWSAPAAGPGEQTDLPTAFGFLDDSQAAQFGFHSPDSLKPRPASTQKMDPAEFTAETGLASMTARKPAGGAIPDGGCEGEARRQIDGGAQPARSTGYESLSDQSLKRTQADDRVAAGIKDWSSCMRQKGFVYSNPQSLATESWGNSVTPREIDTARADVACTRQTNLPGIAFAVQGAIQQQLITQYRNELTAERAAVDARIGRAAQVLKEHGQ